MSDLNPESVPGATEGAELPTPAVSDGASVAAPTSGGVDLDQLIEKLSPSLAEKLAPVIENAVDRRFQSGKDKRWSEWEKFRKGLAATGGDDQAAYEAFNKLVQGAGQPASQPAPGRSAAADSDQGIKTQVAELLTEAGIKYTDPEIEALAKKDYSSLAHWQKDVSKIIARRAKAALAGTVAGDRAGAPAGRPPVEAGNQVDVLADKLTRAVRDDAPTADIERLQADLRQAMRNRA